MRIINVLEIKNGTPFNIESFGIYEEQLVNDVQEVAEKYFLSLIKKELSENDIKGILDNGIYTDYNGQELFIIRSEIN